MDGREGEQLAGDDKPPPMCLERTCGIIGKHSLRGGATNDMYRITCRKVYFNVLPTLSSSLWSLVLHFILHLLGSCGNLIIPPFEYRNNLILDPMFLIHNH